MKKISRENDFSSIDKSDTFWTKIISDWHSVTIYSKNSLFFSTVQMHMEKVFCYFSCQRRLKTLKLAMMAKVGSFPDANGDSSRQNQPGTKSMNPHIRYSKEIKFMNFSTLENL